MRRPPARRRARAARVAGSSPGGRFWKHCAAANTTASTRASTGISAAHASSPSVRELLESYQIRNSADEDVNRSERARDPQEGKTEDPDEMLRRRAAGGALLRLTRELEEREESIGRAAGGEPSSGGGLPPRRTSLQLAAARWVR